MSTTFRIAENSDTETLMQFIQEYYEFDHHPFDHSKTRTTLAKLLNDASLGRIWLIQHGSETVGYIVLTFSYSLEYQGRDAFIDEFYIQENHRRQGIGTDTLQFLEDTCPALNIQALHLEVVRDNSAAQNFYRKIGFRDQERYLMTKRIVN